MREACIGGAECERLSAPPGVRPGEGGRVLGGTFAQHRESREATVSRWSGAANGVDARHGSGRGQAAAMSVWPGSLPVSATDLDVAGRSTATDRAVTLGRVLVVMVVACLALGVILHEGIGGAHRQAVSGGHARGYHQEELLRLPLAAQGPVSAALGGNSKAYRVLSTAGGLRAASPAQHLSVSFSTKGVSVSSGDGRLGLALRGVGYGTRFGSVGRSRPRASANRVTYAPGRGVREWYTNGPLGLEQGFDLASRPRAGSGPLTLSLMLTGDMRARLSTGGVTFSGGGVALRYDRLVVRDASGRQLRAWFALRRGRVLIRVADRGARYPLRVDPFIQQAELTASDGAASDAFGTSVTVSGTTIVVGADGHTVGSNAGQGAAYVFSNTSGTWKQTAELTASDGTAGDDFGYSVAVTGGTVAVGAPLHKVGSNAGQGAVYAFSNTSGTWQQTAELTASDGAYGDELGKSVAVSGGTIVAGAATHQVGSNYDQGAAYVFSNAGAGWTQSAELTASDGGANDKFGASVAVSGGTIAVGAYGHQVGSNEPQGAVYVFSNAGGGWAQSDELTASDGAAQPYEAEFGYSVAVSGATIAVGAPLHQVGSTSEQGAAYVFDDSSGSWVQTGELIASDGTTIDKFGISVAVSGGTVAVGAFTHSVGSNQYQGAGYVFDDSSGSWAQTAELTASDGAARDEFGSSVAVSGGTVAVGAPLHKVGSNTNQGAAYVFSSGISVSGFVYGDQCGAKGCTASQGLDGVGVLVSGTAGDGTSVSETAQTGADGSWSVQVPAGSYTACPSADGLTCGPAGFEPDTGDLGYGNLPVKVAAAPVTGVDFDTCASTQDPSVAGSTSRALLRTGADSGARGAVRSAAASADVSECKSLYTVTVGASIYSRELVDASADARYAVVANKKTHKIAYRDSSGAANALAHSVFLPLNKREYPACFSNAQVEQLSKRGVNVDWYSYIEGGTLPSYTIPLVWNKSTHQVSVADEPTKTKAELTKVFVWRSDDGSGRCYQTEEAPLLTYPAIKGNTFTIIAAWGFPFEGSGVKVQQGIGFIDKHLHTLFKKFGDQGTKLWKLYEHAPEQYKEAAGILITLALTKGAGHVIELLPEVVEGISGEALTTEEAGWLAKFGGVAERIEQSHTVAEVAGWLNGFGGSYPVMSAVIRGAFTNPNAHYDPVNHLYFSGESVLGVSVASTKFPDISLKIERQTVSTKASVLPWANNRAATHATATANAFADNPPDLVNDTANNAGRSYASGDFDAFQNVWADTSQLPAVAKAAKFTAEHKEESEGEAKKSDGHGALSTGFTAEQAYAPSPACGGTGAAPYLQATSKNTICWQFNDGKA
jgi:hypothetical protein